VLQLSDEQSIIEQQIEILRRVEEQRCALASLQSPIVIVSGITTNCFSIKSYL